jgi:NADPH:quinone reductase-like Zn-dependent oxidoreductase
VTIDRTAAAVLAPKRGMTVLATTRSPAKSDDLAAVGVHQVLIDDGSVAPQVRRILPDGADACRGTRDHAGPHQQTGRQD